MQGDSGCFPCGWATAVLTLFLCFIQSECSNGLLGQQQHRLANEGQHTVCRFHAYSDEIRGAVRNVKTSNVLYRASSTLVVTNPKEPDSRYMLFLESDGSCKEEGLVSCVPQPAPVTNSSKSSGDMIKTERGSAGSTLTVMPVFNDFLQKGRHEPDETEGVNRCKDMPCTLDARPWVNLGCARSVLAGALAYRPDASRALLLGVGAGMIPLWVQQARPSLQLDAVDISTDVLDAAPCFGIRTGASSTVQLINGDGRAFVNANEGQAYDVAMVDVFTQDGMPPCLSTHEFFTEVKSRLRPGGVLSVNTWKNDYNSLLRTLKSVFANVQRGEAPNESNRVLVASDSDLSQGIDGHESHDVDADIKDWFWDAQFGKAAPDVGAEGRPGARDDAYWCPTAHRKRS